MNGNFLKFHAHAIIQGENLEITGKISSFETPGAD